MTEKILLLVQMQDLGTEKSEPHKCQRGDQRHQDATVPLQNAGCTSHACLYCYWNIETHMYLIKKKR